MAKSVDARLVRAHIRTLRGLGATIDWIADHSGLPVATVRDAATSRVARCHRDTAIRILTVVDLPVASQPGLSRRMQALAWEGWTSEQIASVAGVSRETVNRVRSGANPRCHRTALISAFEALMRIPVPVSNTALVVRGMARSRGWSPVAAWDDIDDQNERPKGVRTDA